MCSLVWSILCFFSLASFFFPDWASYSSFPTSIVLYNSIIVTWALLHDAIQNCHGTWTKISICSYKKHGHLARPSFLSYYMRNVSPSKWISLKFVSLAASSEYFQMSTWTTLLPLMASSWFPDALPSVDFSKSWYLAHPLSTFFPQLSRYLNRDGWCSQQAKPHFISDSCYPHGTKRVFFRQKHLTHKISVHCLCLLLLRYCA